MVMFGILVCYTLLFNAKDLKDAEGDKTGGIYTIPSIYGSKKGGKIVGVLFGLSFLLAPLFFSFPFLYVLSIPAAVAGYFLVTKFPQKEKYLFGLYFLFIFCGVALYLFLR